MKVVDQTRRILFVAVYALLGVAVGLSPLLVQRASRPLPTLHPMTMPWPTLALALLVVPALAASAAALTGGGPGGQAERRPA